MQHPSSLVSPPYSGTMFPIALYRVPYRCCPPAATPASAVLRPGNRKRCPRSPSPRNPSPTQPSWPHAAGHSYRFTSVRDCSLCGVSTTPEETFAGPLSRRVSSPPRPRIAKRFSTTLQNPLDTYVSSHWHCNPFGMGQLHSWRRVSGAPFLSTTERNPLLALSTCIQVPAAVLQFAWNGHHCF